MVNGGGCNPQEIMLGGDHLFACGESWLDAHSRIPIPTRYPVDRRPTLVVIPARKAQVSDPPESGRVVSHEPYRDPNRARRFVASHGQGMRHASVVHEQHWVRHQFGGQGQVLS